MTYPNHAGGVVGLCAPGREREQEKAKTNLRWQREARGSLTQEGVRAESSANNRSDCWPGFDRAVL